MTQDVNCKFVMALSLPCPCAYEKHCGHWLTAIGIPPAAINMKIEYAITSLSQANKSIQILMSQTFIMPENFL